MRVLLAVCALLALGNGTSAAEILNPPGPPKVFLNGETGMRFAGDTGAAFLGSEPWRYEESAGVITAYGRSRAPSYWGGASVPVWRGAATTGALGGALVKGPGGVPVVSFGAVRGTSGLVFRTR